MRSIVQPGLTTSVCIWLMNAVASGLAGWAHREHCHCPRVTPRITPPAATLGCITPHCSTSGIILAFQRERTERLPHIWPAVTFFCLCNRGDLWKSPAVKQEKSSIAKLWDSVSLQSSPSWCLYVTVPSIFTFCLISCLHYSWTSTKKQPNSQNWRRQTENVGKASRCTSSEGWTWLHSLLFHRNVWKSDKIPEKLHTFIFSPFKYYSLRKRHCLWGRWPLCRRVGFRSFSLSHSLCSETLTFIIFPLFHSV